MTARDFSHAPDRARKIIVVVAAIFLLSSWSFSAWQIYTDREQRIQRHFVSVSNLANVLREQTSEKLRMYEQALSGLSQTLAVTGLSVTNPDQRWDIHRILTGRRVSTAGALQFFILNDKGVVSHSSEALDPEPRDISWRPEFQALLNAAPGTTITVPTLVGEVGAAKGKTIMAMAQRLETADGAFTGVIYVTISLEDFSAVASTLNLRNGGSFGLARTDGTLIMRIPSAVGSSIAQTSALISTTGGKLHLFDPKTDQYTTSDATFDQALNSGQDGILESAVPANSTLNTPSTERYITFRRIPGTDTIVYIGSSKQSVLSLWREAATLTALQQLLLTLLVVMMVLWARRSIANNARIDALYVGTLDSLTAISADFISYRDEKALITRAAKTIRELIPSHLSGVHFMPTAQAATDNAHAFSLSDNYAKWRDYTAPVDGSGIYGVVLETNMPMRLTQTELEAHPRWRGFGLEGGKHPRLNGWLAAPLISQDGRNIGFVQVSDRYSGDFSASDEATLMQFTRVLSISLENIRLMNETTAATAQAQASAAQAYAAAADARATRDQMTKVFSATSDAVVVMDANLRYTFANDAFCAMIGAPREEIIGRTLYERLPNAKNVHEKLELCRDTRKRVYYDNNFTNYLGEHRWIEVQAFPMDDNIVSSIRDVTERRAADQKLMVAQRMDAVGRLSGGLAHDFNNLLAVVMGNAEILSMTLKDQAQTRMANLIRSAAARGGNIVSRLLSFARSRPLAPKPLDVLATAKGVEGLLARSMPSNIAFEITGAEDLWSASADAAQLENVLVNLVLNARDAMPEGGTVTVAASNTEIDQDTAANLDINAGAYVMLSVSDTGTGMPPDVVARAFEPFFTTKEVGKGSGLGLSMVFGFAQQSGGAVRLYSELGKGTTVELVLPRATGQIITGHATAQPYDPTGSERILLVEDDDMVREFVELMLRGLGYRVIAHSGAEAALAAVTAGFHPHLLLADVMLRGTVSGPQLAKQIAPHCPYMRVLYMSGYAESTMAEHPDICTNVEVLAKPFRRHDLAVKVREALMAQSTIIDARVNQSSS